MCSAGRLNWENFPKGYLANFNYAVNKTIISSNISQQKCLWEGTNIESRDCCNTVYNTKESETD